MSAKRGKQPAKTAPKKKKAKAVVAPKGPERLYDFADQVGEEAASEDAATAASAVFDTWVTFTLAGEHYALPAAAVQEILRVESITRVPHAPYTVRGIINMRGRAVPVMDFRLRLGLDEVEVGSKSRILVTETRGRFLGLLVDSAEQVASLNRDLVEPAPLDVMTGESDYIVGVYRHGETLLILLDVEKVLLISDSLEAVNTGR